MLLSKCQLLAARACSSDATRPQLQSIHVEPGANRVTATDGRQMFRVTHAAPPVADYPAPGPDWTPPTLPESFLIPASLALEAAKSLPKRVNLPILAHALVESVNGSVRLSSTDLDKKNRHEARTPDGYFPNCDSILPGSTPAFTISFNVNTLAEWAATLKAVVDAKNADVRLTFRDPLGAMVAEVTTSEGSVLSLLMPVKPR